MFLAKRKRHTLPEIGVLQIELNYPLEVPLRVRPGRGVRIRRANAVHGDIPVDLDIPDKDLGAPHIDTGPMDDGADLGGHQAGAFARP